MSQTKHVHLQQSRFSKQNQEQTREGANSNVFVTVVGLRLSAVEYEPLFHSRYNGRNRTGKVSHEIKMILMPAYCLLSDTQELLVR